MGADQERWPISTGPRRSANCAARPLLDAAYVAKREVANDQAIAYFKMRSTLTRAGTLPLPAQTEFGIKREVADLERKLGRLFLRELWRGRRDASTALAPPPGVGHASRPGLNSIGAHRSSAIATARWWNSSSALFETLYDESGGATGWGTVQGSVGARWKPLSDQNLVLENQPPLPDRGICPHGLLFSHRLFRRRRLRPSVDVPDWLYWQSMGKAIISPSIPKRSAISRHASAVPIALTRSATASSSRRSSPSRGL